MWKNKVQVCSRHCVMSVQSLPSQNFPHCCSRSLMGESANHATVGVPSVRIRNIHVERQNKLKATQAVHGKFSLWLPILSRGLWILRRYPDLCLFELFSSHAPSLDRLHDIISLSVNTRRKACAPPETYFHRFFRASFCCVEVVFELSFILTASSTCSIKSSDIVFHPLWSKMVHTHQHLSWRHERACQAPLKCLTVLCCRIFCVMLFRSLSSCSTFSPSPSRLLFSAFIAWRIKVPSKRYHHFSQQLQLLLVWRLMLPAAACLLQLHRLCCSSQQIPGPHCFDRESFPHSLDDTICPECARQSASGDSLFDHGLPKLHWLLMIRPFCPSWGRSSFHRGWSCAACSHLPPAWMQSQRTWCPLCCTSCRTYTWLWEVRATQPIRKALRTKPISSKLLLFSISISLQDT